METRKMTAKKAKELLYDIETFVHIGSLFSFLLAKYNTG